MITMSLVSGLERSDTCRNDSVAIFADFVANVWTNLLGK